MMIKKALQGLSFLVLLFVFITALSTIIIYTSTAPSVYDSLEALPYNKVGLVPGCSPYTSSGQVNSYFTARINAAVELYEKGKIDYILVSGDNATVNYDEPTLMRRELIKRDIPKEKIYRDYAGFRTLDTVIRAKEVFNLNSFTFISQDFHNRRALYIAGARDLDVIAYNARNISFRYGYKTEVRELFARVKTLLDLFILDKQPRFLGNKIKIGPDHPEK